MSCIIDRCQIKKQSLGGQANCFQEVAWSSGKAEVEREGRTKKGMNKPDFYYTDREEWNVREKWLSVLYLRPIKAKTPKYLVLTAAKVEVGTGVRR